VGAGGLCAGASARDITPSPAMISAGRIFLEGYAFAGRDWPASGVHRPISARAIAIEDAQSERCALLSLDLATVDRGFSDTVLARIAALDLGLDATNTIIAVTHTHAAPVSRSWPVWPPQRQEPDPEYVEFVQDQSVLAVEGAVAALVPVTLSFARGQQDGIALNRRPLAGWYEKCLDVVGAVDDAGHSVATVFSFGCHPVAAQAIQLVSPDFPGEARNLVESVFGGIAIFLQGTGGTVNPSAAGNELIADQVGQMLGGAVVQVLEGGQMAPLSGSITTRKTTIDVPLQGAPTSQELQDASNSPDDYVRRWASHISGQLADGTLPTAVAADLQSVRIGAGPSGWRVVALSHEIVTEFSPELRQLWPADRLTLLGYAGAVDCYFPTQEMLAQPPGCRLPTCGDYEGSASFLFYGLPSPLSHNGPEQLVCDGCVLDPETAGVTGDVRLVQTSDQRVWAFARDVSGEVIYASKPPPSEWSSWTSIGGSITNTPAPIALADGTIAVFARATDGQLTHTWQSPGGTWAPWSPRGGAITGTPAVLQLADGILVAFARGVDGDATHTWQVAPGGAWGPWVSLGGLSTGSPTPILLSSDLLAVFLRGTDGAVWHSWQTATGGAWVPWQSLGAAITGNVTVLQKPDNTLHAFVRGTAGAVWYSHQPLPGGPWTAWIALGATTTGNVSAMRMNDGRLTVFVRNADDGDVLQTWQTSPEGGWVPWVSINGSITGTPTVLKTADERLEAYARGVNGDVVRSVQPTPGAVFGPWDSIGPPVEGE
jgi:hypothetical protein